MHDIEGVLGLEIARYIISAYIAGGHQYLKSRQNRYSSRKWQ